MQFFTVAEVAEHLGVSTRTTRRWIKTGALPVHRFGGAICRRFLLGEDLRTICAKPPMPRSCF